MCCSLAEVDECALTAYLTLTLCISHPQNDTEYLSLCMCISVSVYVLCAAARCSPLLYIARSVSLCARFVLTLS